jgi:hypothetical protein
MQTSRKLCCVVCFFKNYGNCLAVHLRRFMSNRVLSERESECDDVYDSVGSSSALRFTLQRRHGFWFSAAVHGRHTQVSQQLCMAGMLKFLSSCAWQAHSSVSAVVHRRNTQVPQQLCMAGTLKCLSSCVWQAHSSVSAVVHSRHTYGSQQLCMAGTLKSLSHPGYDSGGKSEIL